MDTRKFWQDLNDDERTNLAKGAGLSEKYLYLVFYGHKVPSADKASAIERAAADLGKDVPRATFRPETFA